MVLVGLVAAWLAGSIWKGERPKGLRGDQIAAVITTIVVGLIDWYVIPAMGFSDTLKWLGVAIEPLIAAFIVLWLLRRARQ
jgi:uncharacterized membrane protein YeaQ/YmgE (transglycosylase-associated protein family)